MAYFKKISAATGVSNYMLGRAITQCDFNCDGYQDIVSKQGQSIEFQVIFGKEGGFSDITLPNPKQDGSTISITSSAIEKFQLMYTLTLEI